MKHLLLLASVFTLLVTVSCNRTQKDVQMEEDRPTSVLEKEEYRDDLGQERPDLEEEMEN